MFRIAYLVCLTTAVGLFGWAAFAAFRPAAPEPAVVIAPLEADLGAIPVGERVVVFTITNPSGEPRRVIGGEGTCRGAVCVRSKYLAPIVIPPGESFNYECDLSVLRPGPFENQITIFLEENGLRTVPLTVRGTGVVPGTGEVPK